jgi:outer membrane protein assembly factor BamB
MDCKIYAIDSDGKQKWVAARGGMVLSSAAIDANNTLYVGSNNKTLAAMDTATGALKWEFSAAGAVPSSPSLASDGTIYFGSADGTVYALDSQGKEQWRLKTQGQVLGSAAIAQDGTVYIGSADRQLYAIAATAGPGTGPWPTYRGGLKRTGAAAALPPGNLPPIISTTSATGSLVMGRSGSLSLSCYAVDPDGLLAEVSADLSRILAGASQPLVQGADDTWVWSGAIVPDAYGDKTVTFTATDADGDTRSHTAAVRVLAAPRFVDLAVYGDLIGATETEVTVRCVVEDLDGAAYPAVQVDLSAIGGAAAQVLAPDPGMPNRFVWTGLLTPPAHGTYPVLFTATDADNLVENLSYNVTVQNAVPQLGILSVAGRPVVNQDSPVTISVTANDVDGTVTGVTADLSQIGGPAAPQALTPAGGDIWNLTATVHATALGVWPVDIVATDDYGGTVKATGQVTVVGPPAISNIEVFAAPPLNGAIQSEVTVRCIVEDPQDGLIPPVLVDLSAIGGAAAQPMSADPAREDRFIWTGSLTPPASGSKQITLRATNTDSLTKVTPYDVFIDNKPSLLSPALTGALVVDLNCTVTVSCSSADVDGRIQQVTADLSSIGGLAAQPLQSIGGGQYRWTGTVRPLNHGTRNVAIKMLDDLGVTTTYGLTADVFYAPTITAQDVVYAGEMLANLSKTVTVRCNIDDPDATLQILRADLSWLGGSNVQVLARASGNTWSWTGEIWPSAVGDMVVTFTALTTHGFAVTAQKIVPVTGSVPLLSGIQLSGSLLANLSAPLTIACRADDGTGITGVTADLGSLGVPAPAVFALNSVTGLWVWSGTAMPATIGDKTITITAVAGSGLANSSAVTVPVRASSKWAVPLPLGGMLDSSPAASPDGSTVYIGSTDGNLYAVNAGGSVKWARSLGGSVQSSPAVSSDGKFIYVGSGDGSLYAVVSDNNQAWRCLIGSRVYSSPALSPDEMTVYVGADNGNLYAVNASTGSIKTGWPVALAPAGKVISSPAVSSIDGTVYVGANSGSTGKLFAIKPDGTPKWDSPFQTAGMIWSSPAIGRSPNPGDPATACRVYVASFGTMPTGSTLYALDQDGSLKWSFPLGGTSVYSSPVIDADGTIYIGSDSGRLYALDPRDGLTAAQRKKWERPLDGSIRSVPAVGEVAGQPVVYVGTNSGTLYAINGTDGSISWTLQTGAEIRSSALLTSGGSLYIASYDWNLYAIDVTGGPAASGWPMFRGGELRQGLSH